MSTGGDWIRRAAAVATMCAALLLGVLGAATSAQSSRPRFDIRVLAHIPAPGFGALSLVAPDGTIYVGTFENPAGSSVPSKVFAFSSSGQLLRSYTITGEDLSQSHGVQVAAIDAHGLLYLMDESPSSVITLDPATGQQRTYATFAHLPPCVTVSAGTECKDTTDDNDPEPDYAAWGPDGSMYVTDYQQATIWRVPPGGGTAHVWLTDPRFDGVMFDTAGIVLLPDHHTLLVDTAGSNPSTGSDFGDGKLYTLPIQPDGSPGPLHQIWESGSAQAPDGFAVSQAGNVYVALVGPGANQVVELSSTGQQLAAFPSAASNSTAQVPFDEPSSVQFDGNDLIVTNLSYLEGDSSHQVLFDVYAGEAGMPIYHPPAALTPGPPGPPPVFSLSLSPRHVALGRRTRVVVRASNALGSAVAGVQIRVSGRTVHTGAKGRAVVALRPRRYGLLTLTASDPGWASAVRHVRVVHRARGHRRKRSRASRRARRAT